MSKPRMTKYVRELEPELTRCGYELVRSQGGHFIFERSDGVVITVPGTPSDVRAFDNDVARLKRLHPELFVRRKSENRPTKRQRQERAERREARRSVAMPLNGRSSAVQNGNAEDGAETVPNPGSSEALAQGCTCPRYENNHGVGVDPDAPGTFIYVKGCPLHVAEWSEAHTEPAKAKALSADAVETLVARRAVLVAEMKDAMARYKRLRLEVHGLDETLIPYGRYRRGRPAHGAPRIGGTRGVDRLLMLISEKPGLTGAALAREMGYAASPYIYRSHMLPELKRLGLAERRDGGWYPLTGRTAKAA